MTTDCRVCDAPADEFAQATVLGRYRITYFRCRDCGFVQTESPYWLDDAYQDVIIPTDVGLVARNQSFSQTASLVLRYLYPSINRCVDYGGGYGMFTRMMRDLGHDYAHLDPYCENLFAKGLEADSGHRFEFLTAFEVWEHMADPRQEIARLDALADHWLVSTITLPKPTPRPGEWWYYATEGGQHVALWTRQALQAVANQYDRQLVSAGGLHLFSRTRVNPWLTRKLLRRRGAAILNRWRRRESLLQADYRAALATIVAAHAKQRAA